MLEIEKKFLVNEIPDLLNYSCDEIEQGYLSFVPEIRIRRKGEKFYITRKGEGTQIRLEEETEIDEITYSILSDLVQGRIIQKRRYKIPLNDDLVAELDLYCGELIGLVTVETEFHSESQAQSFVAPNWFGKDVTEDKRYKNKNLARLEEVEVLLDQTNEQIKLLKNLNKKN